MGKSSKMKNDIMSPTTFITHTKYTSMHRFKLCCQQFQKHFYVRTKTSPPWRVFFRKLYLVFIRMGGTHRRTAHTFKTIHTCVGVASVLHFNMQKREISVHIYIFKKQKLLCPYITFWEKKSDKSANMLTISISAALVINYIGKFCLHSLCIILVQTFVFRYSALYIKVWGVSCKYNENVFKCSQPDFFGAFLKNKLKTGSIYITYTPASVWRLSWNIYSWSSRADKIISHTS